MGVRKTARRSMKRVKKNHADIKKNSKVETKKPPASGRRSLVVGISAGVGAIVGSYLSMMVNPRKQPHAIDDAVCAEEIWAFVHCCGDNRNNMNRCLGPLEKLRRCM